MHPVFEREKNNPGDKSKKRSRRWKNEGKKAERRLNRRRINSDATNSNEKKTSAVSYNCKRKVDTNCDTGNAAQKPKTTQVRDTKMEIHKYYPDWTPLEKKTLLKKRAKYPKKATRDNWEQIANAVSAVGPLKRSIKAVSVSMVEAFLSIFVKFSLSPIFTFFFCYSIKTCIVKSRREINVVMNRRKEFVTAAAP